MNRQEAEAIVKANLTNQIRDNLELNGINGSQLAGLTGVDRFHCSKWISGKIMPSLPAALAMSQNLGVTLDRLVTGHD